MSDRKLSSGGVMMLSTASGGGHMAAAEALVAAFRTRQVEASHVEMLRYTTPLFRRVYADLYVELATHRPQLLGYLYRVMNHPWRYDKRRLALDRLNTRPFVRLLEKRRPSVALCTHFLPVDILLYLRRRKLLDIPVGVVITDFDAHAMWLYHGVD
jgi:processive 1,2-diacylglycerol beta-glucosyltransferase